MDFVLMLHWKDSAGNWRQKVVSRHKTKEEAYQAGEKAFKEIAKKGEFIDCITGNVADDGTITGRFNFYKMWR